MKPLQGFRGGFESHGRDPLPSEVAGDTARITRGICWVRFPGSVLRSECSSGGMVDAHGSEPCGRKPVRVQVPLRAPRSGGGMVDALG